MSDPKSTLKCHLQALAEVNNYEDMMLSQELAISALESVDAPEEFEYRYIKAWNKRFREVKHIHKESIQSFLEKKST